MLVVAFRVLFTAGKMRVDPSSIFLEDQKKKPPRTVLVSEGMEPQKRQYEISYSTFFCDTFK